MVFRKRIVEDLVPCTLYVACGQNKRYPTGYKIALPNKGLLCQENAFLFDGESDFCV